MEELEKLEPKVSPKPLQALLKDFLETNVNPSIQAGQTLKNKALMLDVAPKIRKKLNTKTERLSNRTKKKLGMFDIPKDNQRYQCFLPLHKLWKEYMEDLLGSQSKLELKNIETKLLKADYHGALLEVIRSKCPSYVGLRGIVVQEKKNVFVLVTKADKLKVVPKFNCTFQFVLLGHAFSLFGNEFRYTSAMRSGKKFKSKSIMEF